MFYSNKEKKGGVFYLLSLFLHIIFILLVFIISENNKWLNDSITLRVISLDINFPDEQPPSPEKKELNQRGDGGQKITSTAPVKKEEAESPVCVQRTGRPGKLQSSEANQKNASFPFFNAANNLPAGMETDKSLPSAPSIASGSGIELAGIGFGAPGPGAAGKGGFGNGNEGFGTGGGKGRNGGKGYGNISYQDYLSLCLEKIEKNKRYPQTALARQIEGKVKVKICIRKDGQLEYASLIESSGWDALDSESIGCIKRASPFPAPPEDILSGGMLLLTVTIQFELT